MTNNTESKFYALLIGIDNYTSIPTYPQIYPNLGGCVRDINKVKDYLKKTLSVPQEQIWKLTAPVIETNNLASIKSAEDNMFPTYKNIVEAFAKITAAANPGDRVYIHYSGHGGRASTVYGNLKGGVKHDESLVPMDIVDENSRHLRDVEITTLLKRITDKECILTVIFDSCHSGDATRGDYAIRGSKEIDTKDSKIESLVASEEELIANWKEANKSSGVWLPQANEYVFIGACLDTEVAYEYRVDGEKCGALTYWMLNTLTSLPPGSTYQMLFERVNAKVRSELRERQTPVLLGAGDRMIFGSNRIFYQYSVSVANVTTVKNKITEVELSAGMASGLGIGARFGIHLLGATDLLNSQQMAVVEVTESLALKSKAKVISIQEGKTIEQGTQAVMLSPPVDLVQAVNLFEKEEGTEDNQLPPELLVKQEAALEAIRNAMEGHGWIKEAAANERKEHFQVSINQKGEYEIARGLPIDNLFPVLKIGDPDAGKEIVKRLVHLAKYEAVERLQNPLSNLTNALEVKLIPQNSSPTAEADTNSNNVTLVSGDIVTLHIKNISAREINIVVIDLEPTWEVSQIPLKPGSLQKYYQFASGEEINQKLRLKLPDKEKYDKAMEVIKIFAMYGQADFRWLELPPLDQPLQSAKSKGLDEDKPRSVLEDLFAAFGTDADKTPPMTRAEAIFEPGEEWVTKEIQMTVKRKAG